ncbi:ArsC family reductase [Amorphus orientalis]|uniref:Spx/MgsR family transcriptional regulator n=1 Tax=Amorphus orientalis TaxID=649198 RepID=A0AAE3VRU5_9HYPH|nr:ArsC family reductase [Amorphus orientalis]MDQ0317619.1 Spx/MgsR family transcriptional regulator [Amorphus orientalis]
MTVKVHGIKNCDTMKKARAWLDEHGVDYEFHDYKTKGAPPELLRGWAGEVGWEPLLNRAGMTFRKLPDNEKAEIDQDKAIALMSAQPSMIKRPVVEADGKLLIGFKPDTYQATFGG